MSKKRPIISKFQKERILAKTRRRCAYCGCALHEGNTTIDHVKCIASGIKKPNEMSNLLPCCLDCNRKKASLTLEQFRHLVFGQYGVLHSLKENPDYRLALKFGVLKEQNMVDNRFFFERQGSMSNEALLDEFLSGRRTNVVFKKEESPVTIDDYVSDKPEIKEALDGAAHDVVHDNSAHPPKKVGDVHDFSVCAQPDSAEEEFNAIKLPYENPDPVLPFEVDEEGAEPGPILAYDDDHSEVVRFIEDLTEDIEADGVDLSYIKGYLTAAWRYYKNHD